MPIETDHHVPLGWERYRFRPWHERPLTERQLRVVLVACLSMGAGLVAAAGIAVWSTGWTARWLVEPIVLLVISLLAITCHDAWHDLPETGRSDPQE